MAARAFLAWAATLRLSVALPFLSIFSNAASVSRDFAAAFSPFIAAGKRLRELRSSLHRHIAPDHSSTANTARTRLVRGPILSMSQVNHQRLEERHGAAILIQRIWRGQWHGFNKWNDDGNPEDVDAKRAAADNLRALGQHGIVDHLISTWELGKVYKVINMHMDLKLITRSEWSTSMRLQRAARCLSLRYGFTNCMMSCWWSREPLGDRNALIIRKWLMGLPIDVLTYIAMSDPLA